MIQFTDSNPHFKYMENSCIIIIIIIIIIYLQISSTGLLTTHTTTCSQLADSSTDGALHRHRLVDYDCDRYRVLSHDVTAAMLEE